MFGKKHSNPDRAEIPCTAFDKRISAIYAAYQQPGKPSPYLLNLGLEAAKLSLGIQLDDLSARLASGQIDYFNICPGEHYKLLAALTQLLQPQRVVELGTHLGYSALSMKKFLPAGGRIATFDVIPWKDFADSILREEDFDDQLVQFTDDLTTPEGFRKHSAMLEDADIIFMDALKDGVQEYKFLEHFASLRFRKKCLFIFDDIRLWNMLRIWYTMEKPKLDLTSFGHWSGTGLVEWS